MADTNDFLWENYDLGRDILILPPNRVCPSTSWQNSVLTDWSKIIINLFNEHPLPVNKLISVFIELWCAILFQRLTCRQAIKLINTVIDFINVDVQSTPNLVKYLDTVDTVNKDLTLYRSSSSKEIVLPSNDKDSVTNIGSTNLPQKEESLLLLKLITLDSLRFSMEYGMSILEYIKENNNEKVRAAQQRILSLVEVIEKSNLLTVEEVIGNLLNSHLDSISYCLTKDYLSLTKLNVRLRTKHIFTLTTYNLETECNIGYTRLHLLLQTSIPLLTNYIDCVCCNSRIDVWAAKSHNCPVLQDIVISIKTLSTSFFLCYNRITLILLMYMQNYLCTFKHDFLVIMSHFASKTRLQELILFLLRTYEDGLQRGLIKDRRTNLVKAQAKGFHIPSYKFYQLCAYLIMEGVLDLETVWHNLGPSEKSLRCLLGSEEQNMETSIHEDEKIMHALMKQPLSVRMDAIMVQPFGKFNLISAFIDLNGWEYVEILQNHLKEQIPEWSFHMNKNIMDSMSSFIMYLCHRYNNENYVKTFLNIKLTANERPDSRVVGLHNCPYNYGLNICGLKPFENINEFSKTIYNIIMSIGCRFGDLMPSYCLEEIITVLNIIIKKEELTKDVEQIVVNSLKFVILPSLWLCIPRPMLLNNVWNLLTILSTEKRFQLYIDIISYKKTPLLEQACSFVKRSINKDLKRVTVDHVTSVQKIGAVDYTTRVGGGRNMKEIDKGPLDRPLRERAVINNLHKLCCINPFEFFDCILNQVDLFDIMLIKVIINYLYQVPSYCRSVAAFLIVKRAQSWHPNQNKSWQTIQDKPKTSKNISHFVCRFLARFPHEDFHTIILSCVSNILKEISLPGFPDKLSGYFNDFIYLESLINWIGGFCKISTEELSLEQVHCFAAGPSLRFLILADDEQFEEYCRPSSLEARKLLRCFLQDKRLFQPILLSLSKMKLEVLYDSQLECTSKTLQLREVASFNDEIHLALLQLIEFMSEPEEFTIKEINENRAKFSKILPSVNNILRYCDPALAWNVIRSVLPVYGTDSSTEELTKECLDIPGAELNESVVSLISKEMLPIDSPELLSLYGTFWRLDVRDIWLPEPIYLKQISLIKKDLEFAISEKKRAVSRKHDSKNWDKLIERLNNWLLKLETELNTLREHTTKTVEFLKLKKDSWFKHDNKTTWNPISVFIQYMLGLRILNSQNDALFCTKFVELLVNMDTEGFFINEFFNKWTGMLTPFVRSCSIQESDYLGLFVNEMCSMMNKWIRVPKLLKQAAKKNKKCYSRLISKISSPAIEDTATSIQNPNQELLELIKTIGKWENRIFRLIQHGLCLTDHSTSWMSQRIVIKFLNKTHQNFPITDVAGTQILRSLPAVIQRAKEVRWDDVLVNAKALDRNLKTMQKTWLKRRVNDDEDEELKIKKSCAETSPVKEGPKNPFQTPNALAAQNIEQLPNKEETETGEMILDSISEPNKSSEIQSNYNLSSESRDIHIEYMPSNKRLKIQSTTNIEKMEDEKQKKFAILREKLKNKTQQTRLASADSSQDINNKQARRLSDVNLQKDENIKKAKTADIKKLHEENPKQPPPTLISEIAQKNINVLPEADAKNPKSAEKSLLKQNKNESPLSIEHTKQQSEFKVLEKLSENIRKNIVAKVETIKNEKKKPDSKRESELKESYNNTPKHPKAPSKENRTESATKDNLKKDDSLKKEDIKRSDTKFNVPKRVEVKKEENKVDLQKVDDKREDSRREHKRNDTKREEAKKEAFRKEETKREDLRRDEVKREDNRKEDARKEESKREDVKREDVKREDVKREDIRREEVRREEARREEARRDEVRREEVRREEARREEVRREEVRREEIRKEEARREEARKEDLRREDLKRENLRREDIRREDLRREEARREDIRREEARREDIRREEARREDAKREELRREELRREELRREDARREEARKDGAKREESKKEDGRREFIRCEENRKEDNKRESLRRDEKRKADMEGTIELEDERDIKKGSSRIVHKNDAKNSSDQFNINLRNSYNSSEAASRQSESKKDPNNRRKEDTYSSKTSSISHKNEEVNRFSRYDINKTMHLRSSSYNSDRKTVENLHWDNKRRSATEYENVLRNSRMERDYPKMHQTSWHQNESAVPWNSEYGHIPYAKSVHRSRSIRSLDDYVHQSFSPRVSKDAMEMYLNENPSINNRRNSDYPGISKSSNYYYFNNSHYVYPRDNNPYSWPSNRK